MVLNCGRPGAGPLRECCGSTRAGRLVMRTEDSAGQNGQGDDGEFQSMKLDTHGNLREGILGR